MPARRPRAAFEPIAPDFDLDRQALENFHHPYPREVEIFLRTYWVAELEFTDEDGRVMLRLERMVLLDPR
jgi:hypothetical protein